MSREAFEADTKIPESDYAPVVAELGLYQVGGGREEERSAGDSNGGVPHYPRELTDDQLREAFPDFAENFDHPRKPLDGAEPLSVQEPAADPRTELPPDAVW